jgi:hypothetical protein
MMEHPQGEGPGFVDGYKLASIEDYNLFRDDCDSTDDTWKIALDKDDFKVWTRKSTNSKINIVRAWARIEGIPAQVMYDVFHDPVFRTTWDDKMIEGYNIQQLDPHNDIGYYSIKFPSPLQNRDFCNQRSWWVSTDQNEFIIMNHSVPHESCPEKKGFTRGISIRSGYLVRRDPDNPDKDTILIYIAQADPRGMIPSFLINFATKTMAPQVIEKLVNVSRGYPEWKEQNNPEDKPWLTNAPYWWEENEKEDKDKDKDGEKEDKKKKKRKSKKNQGSKSEENSTGG